MPEGASVRTRPEKQTKTFARTNTHTHIYAHIYIYNHIYVNHVLQVSVYNYISLCVYIYVNIIYLSICIHLFVVVASSVQAFMGHGPRLQPLNPRSKRSFLLGLRFDPPALGTRAPSILQARQGLRSHWPALSARQVPGMEWDGHCIILPPSSTVNFDVVSPLP
jgi:hypothetical protein